jgi:AcrR family transcriptional regulator
MDGPPDRPRREEYPDQTRAAVIAAARRLFAENGFFQTKVEEIAKLSRVSPATVYAQCGGKQGLLRSLMDSWTQPQMIVEFHEKSLATADAAFVMHTLSTAYLRITEQWGDVIQVVIDVAPHDDESAAVLAPPKGAQPQSHGDLPPSRGHRRPARRRRRMASEPDHYLLLRHRRPAPNPRSVRLVVEALERMAAGSCLRRSPADSIAQMQHPVALDHRVRVFEQTLSTDRPEVPLA